jgi:hypothetical protein
LKKYQLGGISMEENERKNSGLTVISILLTSQIAQVMSSNEF